MTIIEMVHVVQHWNRNNEANAEAKTAFHALFISLSLTWASYFVPLSASSQNRSLLRSFDSFHIEIVIGTSWDVLLHVQWKRPKKRKSCSLCSSFSSLLFLIGCHSMTYVQIMEVRILSLNHCQPICCFSIHLCYCNQIKWHSVSNLFIYFHFLLFAWAKKMSRFDWKSFWWRRRKMVVWSTHCTPTQSKRC